MPKTRNASSFIARRFQLLICAGILSVAALGGPLVHAVSCTTVSDCSAQVQAAQQQKSQNQATLNQLELQAGSYQAVVDALANQIGALQQQIATNQAEQASVQQQIIADQQDIDQKKASLADDIKTMYIDGSMSTIEELATSSNLSDYVDKEQYRTDVQNQLNGKIQAITALQVALQQKKTQVDQLLTSETAQNDQLASDQSQQAQLLSYNESQQGQYNQQIAANQTQITQLQARIAQLNTPAGSTIISGATCGGGYPQSTPNPYGDFWGCDHPQDNTVDNWGMDNRECVSYTAFRVHEEYLAGQIAHDMPNWGGVGDAYQWIDDARNAGIPVDQNPQAGDIAIRPASGVAGDVGHAMYVESVSGNGNIIVSQYNADFHGTYSEVSRSSAGLYFLHFSEW